MKIHCRTSILSDQSPGGIAFIGPGRLGVALPVGLLPSSLHAHSSAKVSKSCNLVYRLVVHAVAVKCTSSLSLQIIDSF
jgi:hypothetical protein